MSNVILYFGNEVPQSDLKALNEMNGVCKIKEVDQKAVQVFYNYPEVTIANLLKSIKDSDKVRVIGL